MKSRNAVIILTTAVIILAATLSSFGLFFREFYVRETSNWQVQSMGQDMINLLLVLPFITISTILVLNRIRFGEPLWAGGILYMIYTYTIYCFNIHFNRLFIGYCFILGACFYLFLHFLWRQAHHRPSVKQMHRRSSYFISIFLLFTSVAFYGLWLKDIIPYLRRGTFPPYLSETGLATNPVHVLDLAVFLPGIFMTGILLLRKNVLGSVLAPVVLTFMILMDLTIAGLTVMMHKNGLGTDLSGVLIMGLLSLIGTILLFLSLKSHPHESPE